MELYVIRHGIAEDRDPARWPEDRDRPLTQDGEERMRREAAGLRKLVAEPPMLLSSPLARAWRTAEILHEENGWPDPKDLDELEPDCEPAETVSALRAISGVGSLALVGHEPHLSSLTSYLLAGDEDVDIELKKGGAVCLFQPGGAIQPGGSTLRWLLTPKALRALG
jgi:phosphohistidine phosphatase